MKKIFHNKNKLWSMNRMKYYMKSKNNSKSNEHIIILGSVISILIFGLVIAMFLKNRNKKSKLEEIEEETEDNNIGENEVYYVNEED